MLKNSSQSYGILTKFFHWVIASLVLIQFYLVYQRDYMAEDNPLSLTFILTHKAIGMLVLLLAIGFFCWRLVNVKPNYPATMHRHEIKLALWVQRTLILCMLLMPLSGYLMSNFSARAINMFGLFTWPFVFEPNKNYAGLAHTVHVYVSYLMIAGFCLHVAGILKHRFIDKDNILSRMLPY